MKRHLLGVAVFSAIIFSAIGISRLFAVSSDYIPVNISPGTPWEKTSCFKAKRVRVYSEKVEIERHAKSPVVTQAFFNDRTKQININLNFDSGDFEAGATPIRLSYFKEENGAVNLVKSEFITMPAQGFEYDNGTLSASLVASYQWLDNLDFADNLYVQAQISPISSKIRPQPVFDADKAIAVTRMADR